MGTKSAHARAIASAIALAILHVAASSLAQSNAQSPAEQRARYALPWVMRPAIAPTLARVETAINVRQDGVAAVTLVTSGAAIIPAKFGLYVRVGVTDSVLRTSSPATNNIATGAVTNPLLMALFTPELAPGFRIGLSLAATLPVGTGGGNTPSPLAASSIATGALTRSAMDNALFAVNYAAVALGASAAYMIHGLTFQVDATAFQLVRTRGEATAAASDELRTNFTVGASVGYLIHRRITASIEGHYQHWISAPRLLEPRDGRAPPYGQASITVGVRSNVPLSRTVLARPGVAFSIGLGGAMSERECKVFHVDVPIAF